MSFLKELLARINSVCEICKSTENLSEFIVLPIKKANLDESILAYLTCIS